MIETGVLFDDLHSYYDFDLILSAASIPPAKPKTTYVDIPGGDGSVDLTEAHGEVKFYDRDCKFTFSMNPAGDLSEAAYEEKKTEVSNALNGREFRITLDKDSEFYYLGRCEVSEYQSDKLKRQIVITAKVKPYKYKQHETEVVFELFGAMRTVILRNSRKTVCPTFEYSGEDLKVKFGSAVYALGAGTQRILDIQLVEGNNILRLIGEGTVTIRYQEGAL